MSVRIKNTANDRAKVQLHRTATKLIQEPFLLGQRIRLGMSVTISDDDYLRNKKHIDECVSKGVFEVIGDAVANVASAHKLELQAAPEQIAAKIVEVLEEPPAAYAILPPVLLDPPVEVVPVPVEPVAEPLPVPPPPPPAPVVPVPTSPVSSSSAPEEKKGAKKKLI